MNVKVFVSLLILILITKGDTVRGNVNIPTNNLTAVADYLQGKLEPLSDPLKLVSYMIIKEIEERTKLENKITDLQAQLDSTCSELNSQQTQTGALVAFSARVKTDIYGLAVRQIVPFQEVITNIGGGYHPETSIFRCPFRGLYEFTVTIIPPWGSNAVAELMAGGVSRMYVYAYDSGGGSASGSNDILLELQKGDAVYVRIYAVKGSGVRRLYSNFNGRLIHKF